MRLGRRPPSDWRHYEKYPLTAVPTPRGAPVVFGVNWYSNFDSPQKDGTTYWIGRGSLGSIRGGHAICSRPTGLADRAGWWRFYDQGSEGSCVGFACSRAMTLFNRTRYDARWLYHEAQLRDEFPDTPPEEGTTVRAGFEVLKAEGAKRPTKDPNQSEGITAFRWATTWEEVRAVLQIPDSKDGVPLLNSWGTSYPHVVRITDEAGARLLQEDGEAGVPTDR